MAGSSSNGASQYRVDGLSARLPHQQSGCGTENHCKVGLLYNSLERSDQKELLRLMVEKVVVDIEGKVRLELRPPFAYLHEISEQVWHQGEIGQDKTKASKVSPAGECSDWILDCGQYRTRTYNLSHVKGTLCQLS